MAQLAYTGDFEHCFRNFYFTATSKVGVLVGGWVILQKSRDFALKPRKFFCNSSKLCYIRSCFFKKLFQAKLSGYIQTMLS